MTTAGLYARISLDRHDGEGVGRQVSDGRALAEDRGWSVVEYIDNDISAFRAKRRPAWDAMLEDLEAGKLDAVVAYHPDRLYRRLADLERLITILEARDIAVATVRAGDIDLTTATGRMTARIIGAVASAESERTGERVARAKRERAAQGRPAGGGRRPFGLTADRLALIPDEAAQIRRVADALAAGSSYGSEVARLNDAGFTTTTGGPWYTAALRRVMTAPYVAGLRAYRGDLVGEAITPAIIDRDLWDLLRLQAATRTRPGRPPTGKHLLTGLLECAGCGRPMYGITRGSRYYRCPASQSSTGTGCGRSIPAEPLEAHVHAVVAGWLDDPQLLALLARQAADTPEADNSVEIAEIERRRTLAAGRWAAGELSDDEYDTARQVLTARLANLAPPDRPRHLVDGDILTAYRASWGAATVEERRAIIAALATTPLRVGPGRDDDHRVVAPAERVALAPRWVGL